MKKYIAVDSRMICSSGIGTVLQNVLQKLIPKNSECLFYLLGKQEELALFKFSKLANVQCIPFEAPIYSIREQWEFMQKIPENTDVLWVPHYNVPVFYKGKLVVTIHDVFHLAMPQYVKGFHRRMYAKFMFRVATEKACHVICDSKFTRTELCKYVKVELSKIRVIYCGVDKYWYQPNQSEIKIPKTPYILFVGNVKPHKNIQKLIQAFTLIKDEVPHNLIIVGKKEGFITSDPRVAELTKQLSSRVLFTGKIEKSELRAYYKNTAVFVFPSLYEGFGLPPMEAMASGCTNIICSNIPVLKEIYGNSVNYIDPCDVENIKKVLLESIQCPVEKGSEQTEILNKYSWDTAALKIEELLVASD